ncbi:hypothetical protein ABFS83_12G045200 [Erythranthe nasuta]
MPSIFIVFLSYLTSLYLSRKLTLLFFSKINHPCISCVSIYPHFFSEREEKRREGETKKRETKERDSHYVYPLRKMDTLSEQIDRLVYHHRL